MKKVITITRCYCDECGREFVSNDSKRFAKLSSGFIKSVGVDNIQFIVKKRQVTSDDPVTVCEVCTVNMLYAALRSIDELNNPPSDEKVESEDD